MTEKKTLTVDLTAFVSDDQPRFTSGGERIFTGPDEVRVSSPCGNGWCVVDDHGHPFASNLRSRDDAEFVARCVNALNGVVPVRGTDEGAAIAEARKAEASIRNAEWELEKARARLASIAGER
ncbi:hypothetical protein CH274_13405 [Rhodococcus sp. 06-418-5]|uniref:hypothetical protein n=1 Tax=Rhodococcus sp. 06-418-5 TaxID=2022507 RepID=UPI000B9C38CA|nr:hypothetical protein [Rhodococcus sp. 06-418-5]OZC80226.1 hypothetical protein CH274_13405 [Rhodococcus sp. 06-418-5]